MGKTKMEKIFFSFDLIGGSAVWTCDLDELLW